MRMVTKMSGKMLALVVGLFGTLIVCVTILLALGRNPDELIGVSASILIPSLISLITLGQVSDVKRDVSTVKAQTNGHMTAALAAAGVPPVPAPETPEGGKTS